jgi:hypothetical protein
MLITTDKNVAAAGGNPQTDRDKSEIARLRSTSELYNEYKDDWDFFLSAYEGGGDFANEENIFKHTREHSDDFKDRLHRIHYQNYCAPLVDFFTKFIFAETIERNGGKNSDFFSDFINDVNNKGDNITAFMSNLSDDMQIFGMVYVLVDTPQLPEGKRLTRAQERQEKIRPYWVLVRPTEVLDWVTDEFDNYTYIKRMQNVDEYAEGKGKVKLERYTEWTPVDITITDVDVTEPNKPILKTPRTIKNRLKLVPVKCIRYKRSKKNLFMGNSFLRDLAYQNREVMNLTSLLQEFLYRQCFNILAQEVDTNLPLADQQSGELSTSNTLFYPKGAKAPEYIAPSSDPADKISAERAYVVQEMYRASAQDTVNELFNGHKSSGFSKAQSFKTTVPQIATRADILERAENDLMSLTLLYMSKRWDGTVRYKDHYEITNLTDALAQLTTMFKDLQIKSETFVRSQMTRIIHEFDGKIPADKLKKIEEEVAAMDMDEWFDTQKLAFIGKASSSPEAGLAFGTGVTPTGATPIPGKDAAPKSTHPTRPTSTTVEVNAESTKVSMKHGGKGK